MDLHLAGKTAYVTGGARGIGEAIVGLLVEEGVTVAVSDIDGDRLAELRNRWGGNSVKTITANLASEEASDAAEQAIAELGDVPDVLVNNVGSSNAVPFEDTTDTSWTENFNLNFLSHVRASRYLLPKMAESGKSGSVVFIASDLAKQPELMPVEYATAKAGILNLTQILSLRYAPEVRVNAVCPGPIWTDLWTKPGGVADGLSDAYGLSREDAVAKFVADRHLPSGIGEPNDVAALTVFLASPAAKFITAAAISVDGGSSRAIT